MLGALDTPDYVRQEAVAQQVRIYLARDRRDAAEMALQGYGFTFARMFGYPDLPSDKALSHAAGLLYNSSLRVLIVQQRDGNRLPDVKTGIQLASAIIARAQTCQNTVVGLEALLLRAQMYEVLGEDTASQPDYVAALEWGEPEGFVSVFIEQGPPVIKALASLLKNQQINIVHASYVEYILKASQVATDRDNLAAAAPPEVLTSRELEVLQLMTGGLSYQEIAAELFISLNTVRFHVKSLYGKLAVNNRMQAVEAARQLRLL